MDDDNIIAIAQTGTVEDVMNILKAYGEIKYTKWVGNNLLHFSCLNMITTACTEDKDKARKARKIALITAYEADGKKALKRELKKKVPEDIQLKTLRQLAFNGASESVADLLKAQADNEAAIEAIIKGVQDDRKHFGKRETEADRDRRSNKKDVLTEFYTKSGRFAPDAKTPDDTLYVQLRISELAGEVAALKRDKTNQLPAAGPDKQPRKQLAP